MRLLICINYTLNVENHLGIIMPLIPTFTASHAFSLLIQPYEIEVLGYFVAVKVYLE